MGYTSDCDDVTKRDVWTTIHTQQILYSQLVRCLNGCSYAEGDYLVLRARLGRKGTGRITNSYLRAGFLDATEFSGGKWAVVLRNASGSKIDSFSFDIDFHIHIAEQANQQANELPIQLVVRCVTAPRFTVSSWYTEDECSTSPRDRKHLRRSRSSPHHTAPNSKERRSYSGKVRMRWGRASLFGALLARWKNVDTARSRSRG